MPSKLSLIGLIVLILGSVSLVLFTFLLPQFYIGFPLVAGVAKNTNVQTVNSGQTETIKLGTVGGHPLWVSIRVAFILQPPQGQSSVDFDCTANLIYDSDTKRNERIPGIDINVQNSGHITRTISFTLIPPYSSSSYSLALEIDNNGGTIRVGEKVTIITFSLFATVFPAIIAIAGLVVTIVGVVTGRKPSVPRARAAPGGWEPTLQWGGGAAKKQPKMAIKSPTAPPKKVKKVVKKAAPGGAQQGCKFCGKPVPASAYFCPHCYGKLR
jgi:hypothetical protein